MFARFAFLVSVSVAAPLCADEAPAGLVDELFAAARFEGNLANLRDAALADWRDTGQRTLGIGDDPAWDQAMMAANDPDQIAEEFRQGFVTVPFPVAEMETAIAELQTPFGQRLTQIGLDIGDLLTDAENLPGAFAAAELTNNPRVIAADNVLALRGAVDTHIAFMRAAEVAFYLGFNGQSTDETSLPAFVEADLRDYMADWDGYFEDIREDVTLSYRQMFFLVTEGFTDEEVDAWVRRAEQPWAQAFEAAFQAGYRQAFRQSMYRQGQAVAAWEDAEESGD